MHMHHSGSITCYHASRTNSNQQKDTEKSLRESESRYRLIAENAYDIISIVDRNTLRFKYISPSYDRIIGYSAEELLGEDIFKYVHPDDKARLLNIIKEGIRSGSRSGSAQYRSRHKNGNYLWMKAIGKIIEQEEFKDDILLVTRDITGEKLAKIAFIHSREKYRLIVDNAYDGISIVDSVTFMVIYHNPALEQMLGYNPDTWPQKSLLEFIYPDDRHLVMETLDEGIKRGEGSLQCRLEKSDGSFIWAEVTGKLLNQEGKNPQLLFMSRNISERKQAEAFLIKTAAQLQDKQQELKQQLDYLNYLINNMHEVFVTYNLEKNITLANGAALKHLGYQPDEVIGRSIFDFIADSHKNEATAQVIDRLEKGEAGVFETLVKRKNGSENLMRIKSSPIKEDTNIIGAMLLIEDISEHRKIEKEMARLDQLNTVGEIAAGIGHEIRNPMTTVKGFLQILSQHEDFDRYQHYFSLMLEELERANSIISEFLALAKNKLVDLRPWNLNTIITTIFPLLQADATLTDKSIVLQLDDIPDILADEKEIRQLLLNLVRNGLESMQPGGRVYIKTYLEADHVVLSVRDEGKGIDSEILEKLGKPFVTTKENGTGLGLAICYSIVSRHEATIQPYTTPMGSTFVIRFKVPPLSAGQITLPLI